MTGEPRERISRSHAAWKTAFVAAAWILPWALLILHLSAFWTLAPDYQYGWAVLPLCAYLLFRQWTGARETSSGNRGAAGLAIAFAALLLPIWWVRAVVPDWSVISYALTIAVIAYTLALAASQGSWRTAWTLAFPICFILCAVPWPQRAENAIIGTLTKVIAAGAVEALQWMGIGAIRQGNLISLATGTVGISDACSGIRSLQSMLVAALALGEIYSLKIPRRFALVAAGVVTALALNLLRNVILASVAASYGMAALERWHDPAGWAILLVSLPLLFLIARRWRGNQRPIAPGGFHLRPLPMWSAVALTIWFCAIAGGVELWYRAHEWHAPPARHLEVRWPKQESHFEAVTLDDRTRDMLLCSNARGASWSGKNGTHWHLTFITWAPGLTSAQSARMHRPEVCFQATGAQFLGKRPIEPIAVPGGTLFFEPLEFQAGNEAVHVFFCLYEAANRDDPREVFQTPWARVHRAFQGQRNLGQQSAEISVEGFPDSQSASKAVAEELPAILSLRAP